MIKLSPMQIKQIEAIVDSGKEVQISKFGNKIVIFSKSVTKISEKPIA